MTLKEKALELFPPDIDRRTFKDIPYGPMGPGYRVFYDRNEQARLAWIAGFNYAKATLSGIVLSMAKEIGTTEYAPSFRDF